MQKYQMIPAGHGVSSRGMQSSIWLLNLWNLKEPKEYFSNWKDLPHQPISELWCSIISSNFIFIMAISARMYIVKEEPSQLFSILNNFLSQLELSLTKTMFIQAIWEGRPLREGQSLKLEASRQIGSLESWERMDKRVQEVGECVLSAFWENLIL